ncbi:hypothetical protein B0A55_12608 [Friedmanniomyces simplex]|uniref:UBC core domain-containing protein n=1 Tax=Friedmanniomyces simplex TaxID=329884 RepID=A0A4U0WL79_9PEZI|nr:hypothetical protein B0A55_12608 [Friedmanniomyces simplex]
MSLHKAAPALLRRRLLQDVAELQSKPYPGIKLHIEDENALQTACLILSPEGEAPLHLTISFGDKYPLVAPKITMQGFIKHPNVFGDYICASILNTKEGYTPAYTLKGICIQLLSFFSSDKIEQEYGGILDRRMDLQDSWMLDAFDMSARTGEEFSCKTCGFHKSDVSSNSSEDRRSSRPLLGSGQDGQSAANESLNRSQVLGGEQGLDGQAFAPNGQGRLRLTDLPNELLILVTEHLDDGNLFIAARAWNGFGRLISTHNLLAIREMRCFTLKEGFRDTNLGVGVHVQSRSISSEFDFISDEAFTKLRIRCSVQGLDFEHWLPLPFSEAHWKRVRGSAVTALQEIGELASVQGPAVNTLFAFVKDVVVKLSQAASGVGQNVAVGRYRLYDSVQKSKLTHASEKAVESHFQLYHLLVTIATDRPKIVAVANAQIARFVAGESDKQACPNLGHLLVALLISDTASSVQLTKAIIKEAVTRNVVWMLDGRGAGMAELSYLEPSDVSDYRLQKTYEASKISYNLLMFANLMLRTVSCSATPKPHALPGSASGSSPAGTKIKIGAAPSPLKERRDELFSRHGAPPEGAAAQLAASIRSIQKVETFPAFLQAMEVPMPSKAEFTRFLRRTVCDSVEKGYSKWTLKREEALAIRLAREPTVEVPEGMQPASRAGGYYTFFPGKAGKR